MLRSGRGWWPPTPGFFFDDFPRHWTKNMVFEKNKFFCFGQFWRKKLLQTFSQTYLKNPMLFFRSFIYLFAIKKRSPAFLRTPSSDLCSLSYTPIQRRYNSNWFNTSIGIKDSVRSQWDYASMRPVQIPLYLSIWWPTHETDLWTPSQRVAMEINILSFCVK